MRSKRNYLRIARYHSKPSPGVTSDLKVCLPAVDIDNALGTGIVHGDCRVRIEMEPCAIRESLRELLAVGGSVCLGQPEPFAVILGDDVIDANPPALRQMIDVYERVRGPVLAVERVAPDDVSSYGIVAVDESETLGGGVFRVKDLVEKPRREDAPSNLAIIGRYILTPDIFDALEATSRDKTGEIQLTNGLRRLLRERPVYVYEIDGVRHDTGNKLGFLKALVYFALRRPDLAEPFRRYLESLDLKIGAGT